MITFFEQLLYYNLVTRLC